MFYEHKNLPASCIQAQFFQDYAVALELLHMKVTGDYQEEIGANPFNLKEEPIRHTMYKDILHRGATTCYHAYQLDESILNRYIRDDLTHIQELDALKDKLTAFREAKSDGPKSNKDIRDMQVYFNRLQQQQRTLDANTHTLEFIAPIIAGYDFSGDSIETRIIKTMAVNVDFMLSSLGNFTGFNKRPDDGFLSLELGESVPENRLKSVQEMLKNFETKIRQPPSSPDAPTGP